jgi:hypothetical protein
MNFELNKIRCLRDLVVHFYSFAPPVKKDMTASIVTGNVKVRTIYAAGLIYLMTGISPAGNSMEVMAQ